MIMVALRINFKLVPHSAITNPEAGHVPSQREDMEALFQEVEEEYHYDWPPNQSLFHVRVRVSLHVYVET